MILKTDNIESLLPHRSPFIFLDEILSADESEIIGQKIFNKEDTMKAAGFADLEYVPSMVLMESMAQCGGAGMRLLGFTEGLYGFAGIEAARFFKGAEYGKPVKYVIRNVKVSTRVIKQSGTAYVDEHPVAEAVWTCIKLA